MKNMIFSGEFVVSFKRIMIFGRSGSGKSTFAYELHKKTGLPLYHLDRYFFKDNASWVERNYADFLADQFRLVETDSWIIDGNSRRSLEMRYAHADLCLYFNFSRWRCLCRIVKRYLGFNNSAIKDRPAGCKEAIRWSLISYLWTFNKRVDPTISYLKKKYPHVRFIELTNDKAVREFYKQNTETGF